MRLDPFGNIGTVEENPDIIVDLDGNLDIFRAERQGKMFPYDEIFCCGPSSFYVSAVVQGTGAESAKCSTAGQVAGFRSTDFCITERADNSRILIYRLIEVTA